MILLNVRLFRLAICCISATTQRDLPAGDVNNLREKRQLLRAGRDLS